MDEDDDVIPHIKCDIELDVTAPNDTTIHKMIADTLRKLADRIENGEFDDGFHPVNDSSGKPVGEIYFDYYGERI